MKDILNYPRPTLRRDQFCLLNGEWDFVFDDENIGEKNEFFNNFPTNCLKINVPYAYQTELSGINKQERHDIVWYKREIEIKDDLKNKSVLLHFEASDYITTVYVNGKLATTHRGGYERFSVDIAPFIKNGKASIVVRCLDTYDTYQPRGKQKWQDKPWGCWYQEINGIWRTVWYEIVDKTHISSLKITPINNKFEIEIESQKETEITFKGTLSFKGEKLVTTETRTDKLEFELKNIKYWNFNEPNLYDIKIEMIENNEIVDVIETQAGYREITTKDRKILINNKPAFLRLALEQGYYKKGIYTFASIDEMVEEIKWIQKLGFNGIRMHQKVEDERFYYLCDLYGIYVWCEMPSCYDFSKEMTEKVKEEWSEVIKQFYNNPSIIVWTPLNESWGVKEITNNKEVQQFAVDLYNLTKAFDKTRLVVSNDGWIHCKTDLVTLHNYIQNPEEFRGFSENILDIVKNNRKFNDMDNTPPFAEGFKYENQPILFDEFCGIALNLDSVNEGWGYGENVKNINQYIKRYEGLIKCATLSQDLAGWCMTQITDVYSEVNGLLTMDRKPKVDPKIFKNINEGIFKN